MPLFISFFFALRGMAYAPLESLKTGGLFWFTDLTVVDPYYALPILACVSFLINIEVWPHSLSINYYLIINRWEGRRASRPLRWRR